ncbi:TRAF-like [Sesbania bispinosa]|nr:TRAF-like [Sesbania bispinosa]
MEHQQSRVDTFEKFTWTIENFSSLNVKKLYSETFVLGGYPWRILVFPHGNKVQYLSIYLDAVNSTNLPEGWSRDVRFRLAVLNQLVSDKTITKEVSVIKSKHENQVNRAASLTASLIPGGQAGHMGVEVPKLEGQGLDLGTLSKVSELDSTKPAEHTDVLKRSRKFTEWAFTALGRVLYFLITRKVKDMNDITCKDLQLLWEELKSFGFDLIWLEPHVQSALGMKNYVERAMEMKKLKENVEILELEMKKLDANLDMARDRLIAEGFEEIDLDDELGYGRP